MNNKIPKELKPWYRGFQGNIYKLGPGSWLSKGVYKIIGMFSLFYNVLNVF